MSIGCTRCQGTGFLNVFQVPDEIDTGDTEAVLKWMAAEPIHDVQVCDCCGDGEDEWHGVPGEHYNAEDPAGRHGPYASNGGLCECH